MGTGNIAKKFANDLQLVAGAKLVAIGSRSKASADKFALELKVPNSFASYDLLAKSKEVDAIYIATPHTLHFENTLLCLNNGKAVLCEKPFAMTTKQLTQMIALAKEKNIFLMEGMWMKTLPVFRKCVEMVRGGTLGDLKSAMVNFGFAPLSTAPDRLTNKELGGGSLMDIGVYNAAFVLAMLGKPMAITAVMTPAERGADAQCAATFVYDNGALAQLFSSFVTHLPTEAFIAGTLGSIKLSALFYRPTAVIEHTDFATGNISHISFELKQGNGYQYEAAHVGHCLREGKTESEIVSFADSLLLMEVLDAIREKAGIHYQEDDFGPKQ